METTRDTFGIADDGEVMNFKTGCIKAPLPKNGRREYSLYIRYQYKGKQRQLGILTMLAKYHPTAPETLRLLALRQAVHDQEQPSVNARWATYLQEHMDSEPTPQQRTRAPYDNWNARDHTPA